MKEPVEAKFFAGVCKGCGEFIKPGDYFVNTGRDVYHADHVPEQEK